MSDCDKASERCKCGKLYQTQLEQDEKMCWGCSSQAYMDKHFHFILSWIDVKNNLPKLCEPVLITDGIVVGCAMYFPPEEKWMRVDYEGIYNCDITHWMPLPPPPTK